MKTSVYVISVNVASWELLSVRTVPRKFASRYNSARVVHRSARVVHRSARVVHRSNSKSP